MHKQAFSVFILLIPINLIQFHRQMKKNHGNSESLLEKGFICLPVSSCIWWEELYPAITTKTRVKTSTGQWQNSSVLLSHNSWFYFKCIRQLPELAFKGSLHKECSSQIDKGLLPIQVTLEYEQEKKGSEANFDNFLLTQFQHIIKFFLCGYAQ